LSIHFIKKTLFLLIKFAADFIRAVDRGKSLANSCITVENKKPGISMGQAFLTSNRSDQ